MTIPWMMNCGHSADGWCLKCVSELGEKYAALRDSRDEAVRLVAARKLVDKQAEDAGLWFDAQTAPEGYLQAALRELHAVIEGDSWFAPSSEGHTDTYQPEEKS